MSQSLQQLAEQAAQLHAALQSAAGSRSQYESHQTRIQACADEISRCVRLVGNQRIAAMSAKDTRKVMAELETALEEMQRLLRS